MTGDEYDMNSLSLEEEIPEESTDSSEIEPATDEFEPQEALGEEQTDEESEDARESDPTKPRDARVRLIPQPPKPLYPFKKPYYSRYYMLYGQEEVPEKLDLKGTGNFLGKLGFGNNFLKMAREGRDMAAFMENTYKGDNRKKIYCDFCGVELVGTEVNVLKDGRVRCPACERTAVRREEDFLDLYHKVIDNLKLFYGISIDKGITIKMTNARTLHKKLGMSFVPTAEPTARVLGVAIKDKDGYSIYLENGSPRLCAIKTLTHELTHIWQYQNWDADEILKLYGSKQNIEIYEGMAKWSEIQYMYLLGESGTAKREELETLTREDEYGRGFRKYISVHPLSYGMSLEGTTPFDDVHRPL